MEYIDKKKSVDKKGLTFYDRVCMGYMKDIEKKKKELAKKGIRDLHRTPGSLITKKGHIDGYLSAFGEVTGKISFTPDQAEKAMGFRPKEGATGVLLSRRRYVDENGKVKSGIFAISLMPHPNTPTEKMKRSNERIRVIGKMASRHMSDIIHPIWEPLVTNKSRKPWTGFHYFESVNLKNIGSSLDWSKLLISNGKLSPPREAYPNWYDPEKRQIHIIIPRSIKGEPITINQIGVGIFDIITGDFFHISPVQIREDVEQRLKVLEMKIWELRWLRKGRLPNMRPLELSWELKKIRKQYHPETHRFGKKFSRFFIYTYYKRQIPEISKQYAVSSKQEPATCNLQPATSIPHNSLYSPSISSRIKVRKGRTDKRNGIPILITLVE